MELFKDLVDLSCQMQNPQKPTTEWEILAIERLELTTLKDCSLVNIVSVINVMFNAAILPNHYFSVSDLLLFACYYISSLQWPIYFAMST